MAWEYGIVEPTGCDGVAFLPVLDDVEGASRLVLCQLAYGHDGRHEGSLYWDQGSVVSRPRSVVDAAAIVGRLAGGASIPEALGARDEGVVG